MIIITHLLASKKEEDVAVQGWEDTWEDDEKEVDFFVQLEKEKIKKDGVSAMKM